MRTLAIVFALGIGLAVNAQSQEVVFRKFSDWQEVLSAAQRENKYIFVDVFATWCTPCIKMDKEVYSSPNIARSMNSRFISVKIQEDRTAYDSQQVIDWYGPAEKFVRDYQISSLPCLLFFSPSGELIDKRAGYQDVATLAGDLDSVLVKGGAYQQQLELYRRNVLPFPAMPALAIKAAEMHNLSLSDSLVNDYKSKFLYLLPDSLLLTKDNVNFITSFSITSKDRIFNLFYLHPDLGDKLTESGFSREIVRQVISKEEIYDKLSRSKRPQAKMRPDWQAIREEISRKYGENYGSPLTATPAKIAYYRSVKNWKQYTKLINLQIRRYPPQVNGYKFADETRVGNFFQRDDWNLNSAAWNIFLYCNENGILRSAIKWSELSISIVSTDNGISPIDQYYDTKANLLYKIGKINKAISIEEHAYKIARDNARTTDKSEAGKGYLTVIRKMKEGKPTWNLSEL